MKTSNQDPADGKLGSLLRESRTAPGLPPRFQENVWRRIEHENHTAPALSWVEVLAALVLKPRFAFAIVAVILLAGGLLGSLDGTAQARRAAQDRYIEAVAMNANQ